MFLVKGKGYYEQYKAGAKFSSYGLPNPVVSGTAIKTTDLVRQLWLDNDFYGQILSLQYKKDNDHVTLGGGWNHYIGNHFGKIIWAQTGIEKDYQYYHLDADKTDANVYAKWQRSLSKFVDIYADLQYRTVDYNMNGFRD